MAKVAEGMARVADGIAKGRQQRSELAVEIKNATRNRRSEVRSLLAGLNASRGRSSREQATEIQKATRTRHRDVLSFLAGAQASRARASREHRSEAIAMNNGRRNEVKALLTQFGRERIARRQHRLALAVAQRGKAAAFMRDLTSGVAALRDGFAKEGRDRAAAIRENLGAYALDRRNGLIAWMGVVRQKREASIPSAGVSHRPAEAPSVHPEPPVPPSTPAKTDEAAPAAHAPEQQTHRSGRRIFGGSGERHGGDSK